MEYEFIAHLTDAVAERTGVPQTDHDFLLAKLKVTANSPIVL
jgi:hypothetical protein